MGNDLLVKNQNTISESLFSKKEKKMNSAVASKEIKILVCDMALGYADKPDIVNTFHAPRVTT
jgi:hypothetical protein